MIRNLINTDREKIKNILIETNNFNHSEIDIALELIDVYLNDENQKDYEIFVDADGDIVNGYICIGPRPLTKGTYDLYWIAVNPNVQAKGIGSGLVKYIEEHIAKIKGRFLLIETSGKHS